MRCVTTNKRGGTRPGAGRKHGQKNKFTEKVKEAAIVQSELAASEGKLPHEILLSFARGEKQIEMVLEIEYHKQGPKKGEEKSRKWVPREYYPDRVFQYNAAKAAAPYYAPKLATQMLQAGDDISKIFTLMLQQLADNLPS